MATDPSYTMERIEQLLGRFTDHQRGVVLVAIEEARAAVLMIAEQIASNPKLDSPLAVFVSAIARGQHLQSGAGPSEKPTPEEAFHRLYDAKLDYLGQHSDWPESAMVEHALDYAVSYLTRCNTLPFPPGVTPISLEDDYRRAIGKPRPATTGDARAAMLADWRIIATSLHDPRIAAMHRALMQGMRVPGEPSHEEAYDARLALVAEILALGVKPRARTPTPGDRDFVTIGEALDEPRA